MNDLLHFATAELARFLNDKLPELSAEWWQKHVVDRLSFQQQRIAQERGFNTLQQLDFAALLRVLDKNWYELAGAFNLPREGRIWVRELQIVRNNWAHLSAQPMAPSEVYRDADTLGRLLAMIGASHASIKVIEESKAAALAAMTNSRVGFHEGFHKDARESALTGADIPEAPTSDLIGHEPEIQGPISRAINESGAMTTDYGVITAEVWSKAVTLAMLSTFQKARLRSPR